MTGGARSAVLRGRPRPRSFVVAAPTTKHQWMRGEPPGQDAATAGPAGSHRRLARERRRKQVINRCLARFREAGTGGLGGTYPMADSAGPSGLPLGRGMLGNCQPNKYAEACLPPAASRSDRSVITMGRTVRRQSARRTAGVRALASSPLATLCNSPVSQGRPERAHRQAERALAGALTSPSTSPTSGLGGSALSAARADRRSVRG